MRGDGRVFQRGNRWWIAYYAPKDGRYVEHRESAGDTEAKARKLLKDRLRAVANHRDRIQAFVGPKQERRTLEELLQKLEDDYEINQRPSLAQLRSHLRHIRAFFGSDRAIAVTSERLRDYIGFRQSEGAANATINRELEGVQRAFSLAVEDGFPLTFTPRVPNLPEHNARQGFFKRSDFEAVVSKLKDANLRDYLWWFFWTGMRPKEIKSLTWECFDKETWTLRLHAKDAKTRHGRVIALEGPLREIIQRRIEARRVGCPFIFHRFGRQIGEFRKAWKTACKEAKVSGKRPYDLRRTAVRNMSRAGVLETVAMAISGHRTRAVFDRYNITSEEDLRDAVAKTAAYVESLPTTSKVVDLSKRRRKRAS